MQIALVKTKISKKSLQKKDADEIIMKARESWFKEDKKSKEQI